jgi:hypothetical protein
MFERTDIVKSVEKLMDPVKNDRAFILGAGFTIDTSKSTYDVGAPPANYKSAEAIGKWRAEQMAELKSHPENYLFASDEVKCVFNGNSTFVDDAVKQDATPGIPITPVEATVLMDKVIEMRGILFVIGGWPTMQAIACKAIQDGFVPSMRSQRPLEGMLPVVGMFRHLNPAMGSLVPGAYDPLELWFGRVPRSNEVSMMLASLYINVHVYSPECTAGVMAARRYSRTSEIVRELYLDTEALEFIDNSTGKGYPNG